MQRRPGAAYGPLHDSRCRFSVRQKRDRKPVAFLTEKNATPIFLFTEDDMARRLIAPEVLEAAGDAGFRFTWMGVPLPEPLNPNGATVMIDASAVRTLRLRHYDRGLRMLLIEIVQGRGSRFALAGVDGTATFVSGVEPAGTVSEAMRGLAPPEVIAAQEDGKSVTRQGHWFFYQGTPPRQADLFHFHPLEEDHMAEQVAVPRIRISHLFVLGMVTHRAHRTLCFERWHRAVRHDWPAPGVGRVD
jgi:hypothetical protein